jgi:hypothetical protein
MSLALVQAFPRLEIWVPDFAGKNGLGRRTHFVGKYWKNGSASASTRWADGRAFSRSR